MSAWTVVYGNGDLGHAGKRSLERQINRRTVNDVLNNGKVIEYNGHSVNSGRFPTFAESWKREGHFLVFAMINNRPIHVVVLVEKSMVSIKTMYVPYAENFGRSFCVRQNKPSEAKQNRSTGGYFADPFAGAPIYRSPRRSR